jgi:hypothetical protein
MPKEIAQVGEAIGDFFASPIIQLGIRAIVLYIVVLWLAGSYWAFRDMQLRTDNPILPYLAASFIIVSTPLAFPFAVFVYRIIRPQEKIGEVDERNLAEAALLAEVESIRDCPTCAHRVHDDWIICPFCRTRLNRVCPNCSRLVGLDWSLCAWCGKDFERREVPALIEPMPAGVGAGERGAVAGGATRASVRASAARASAARTMTRPTPARPQAHRASTDPLPER